MLHKERYWNILRVLAFTLALSEMAAHSVSECPVFPEAEINPARHQQIVMHESTPRSMITEGEGEEGKRVRRGRGGRRKSN